MGWMRRCRALGLVSICTAAALSVTAHAQSVARPQSAAPADLVGIPQTQPSAGDVSLAVGVATVVDHRPAELAAPERYGVTADLVLSLGLLRFLQLDVSLPARLDLSLPAGGDSATAMRLDALRVGGKLTLPWLVRAPWQKGVGAALLFSADLPTAVNSTEPLRYTPAFAIDVQPVWPLLFTSYTAVPLALADDGSLGEARLALGGGFRLRLCRECGVSVGAAIDGSLRLTDAPGGERVEARGLLLLQLDTASGWIARAYVEMPLDKLGTAHVRGGFMLELLFGAEARRAPFSPRIARLEGTLVADAGAAWPDGTPLPARELLVAKAAGLQTALWQMRASFPAKYGQLLVLLDAHLDRMGDLLEGAEAHPEDAPGLVRSASVGLDLAAYLLDELLADSTPNRGWLRGWRLRFARDWCWEGIRYLEEDPFWVDHEGDEATAVHREADVKHDQNIAGEEQVWTGAAGVQAALVMSGGASLAQLVGELPQALVATRAELARLAAALGRTLGGGGQGGRGVLLAGADGTIFFGIVPAGSRAVAATVGLTEAEIRALIALGRLPPLALAVHMRRIGQTPAQVARERKLSGTNSVTGRPPPGFRSSQRWDTSANAKILRQEMETKRGLRFGKDKEAHHIVPSTHRDGEEARKLFDEHGLDVNGVDNGAVLSVKNHHGKGLHSTKGINEVTRRLVEAEKNGGQRGLLDELQRLRDQIERGEFKVSP